ncbi:MAG: hypothetical protein JO053_03975 [Acidobacteria bacterium]|nr:hypothetical protein [Acidobacteriota bacterium]
MSEQIAICPGCGADISTLEKYCPKCGAPTENVSNLDPASLPEAEGRAFQRAVSAPRKPIVVICVWLLFFPILVIGVMMIVQVVRDGVGTGAQNLIFFWMGVGGIVLAGNILYRVTSNYFRPPETEGVSARRGRRRHEPAD